MRLPARSRAAWAAPCCNSSASAAAHGRLSARWAAASLKAGRRLGRFAAGVLWGWTPCGVVYSMLALALVSGGALRGAAVMLAFGLGTLPNLLGAGWMAQRLGPKLNSAALRTAAGLGIVAFGVFGLIRVPGLFQQLREGLLCLRVAAA